MKLNELKVQKEFTKVNIGNKEIEISPWSTKDEKNYLKLLESAERDNRSISDDEIYNVLIKPVIKENDVVLSANEQKMLLIEIRKISISDEVTDIITCECGIDNSITKKIDDIVKFTPSNFKEVKVQDITFVFDDIKYNKDKSKMKLQDGLVNYIFTEFLLHIREIHYKDNIFKYGENMSFLELQEFIEDLSSSTFDTLFQEYHNMVDNIEIRIEATCSCSRHISKDYTSLPGFLWL